MEIHIADECGILNKNYISVYSGYGVESKYKSKYTMWINNKMSE